ncbi:nucleotidyltransferase domain-containing protein [Algisphaera agarilytica]|uniref:Putative nucleotidyltransferase n=1 Tax=Algisphaera agarilytica TaxID=1385975 RepID=A0A7X0H6Z7_9BACT|nr:nucleotidyltransferase domain-containing protein [Algisphaera agarilytica]MBB6430273.1 putative nucleotidyltransferase [Algisphaera agarilytica]
MYKHHQASIDNVRQHFADDPEVTGVLLGGSIAHGSATEASDIDIMLVVADERYEQRKAEGAIHFFSNELAPYEGGYVDGKYTSRAYMQRVAQDGSEPSRYAFLDTQVLLDRDGGLDALAQQASAYPDQGVDERIAVFYAQLEGWRWYCGEALRHGNPHLLNWSVGRLVLFGGRMLLAHNRLLFPYHKWFLRVLDGATEKPDGIGSQIDTLYREPTQEHIETFFESVRDFRDWPKPATGWPARFMADSELAWLSGPVGVDDW